MNYYSEHNFLSFIHSKEVFRVFFFFFNFQMRKYGNLSQKTLNLGVLMKAVFWIMYSLYILECTDTMQYVHSDTRVSVRKLSAFSKKGTKQFSKHGGGRLCWVCLFGRSISVLLDKTIHDWRLISLLLHELRPLLLSCDRFLYFFTRWWNS